LFGIIQQGSFNAAESGDLFEIFKVTYVSSRQKQIEWLLNYMCSLSGSTAILKLQDVSPLGVMRNTAADAPAAAVEADPLAAGEIDVAKTALNGAQIASIIDVVAAIKEGVLTPEAALQVLLASFPTIAEAQAREIVGLQSGDMSFCNHKQMFSKESIELFLQHGEHKDNFEIIKSVPIEWDTPAEEVFRKEAQLFDEIGQIMVQLTDLEKSVLTLLEEDDEEAGSIAKALGEPLQVIVQVIDKLVTLGLYEKPSIDPEGVRTGGSVTSTGGEIVNKIPTSEQPPYEIRYSYEKRKDVPAVKTTSRDFCKALMGAEKLYSREEIEFIGDKEGRDVWRYRGGWYTNPDTGKSTPWCRHIWMQNLVKRKP
jgi:DNA-binding MarR family transcriptional regulator